jgi:hypothetical protein
MLPRVPALLWGGAMLRVRFGRYSRHLATLESLSSNEGIFLIRASYATRSASACNSAISWSSSSRRAAAILPDVQPLPSPAGSSADGRRRFVGSGAFETVAIDLQRGIRGRNGEGIGGIPLEQLWRGDRWWLEGQRENRSGRFGPGLASASRDESGYRFVV